MFVDEFEKDGMEELWEKEQLQKFEGMRAHGGVKLFSANDTRLEGLREEKFDCEYGNGMGMR